MTSRSKTKSKKKTHPARKTILVNKPGRRWLEWSPLVFLGIILLIFLQARIQLLAIPLERDEGSFAYIGHWLLRGKDLYTDMLDSKLPGLYAVYAFSTTLFGYNATGVHAGLLVSNLTAAFFFYLLLREIFNRTIAAIATAFLLILILSPNVNGFAAHATQLLLPFVFAGCWLFWKGLRENRLHYFFLAGLMIGISFTIKQQTALFGLLLAGIWWPVRMIWYKSQKQKLPIVEWLLLAIGGILPLLCVVGYYTATDRFDEFIFWTYQQPLKLTGSMRDPWYQLLWEGIQRVNKKFELIWLTSLAGVILLFFSGFKQEQKWFTILFTICCVASIGFGVAYYNHYFVVVMPAVAICTAIAIHWITLKLKTKGLAWGIALASLLIMVPLAGRSDYYFKPDYTLIHQEAYKQNMFPELEKIGQELSRRVPKGGKIAILGSEPEVLVAAQREACTKYLMVYSMLIDPDNAQRMQDEYYADITQCGADYVVFDIFSSSWAPGFEKLGLHSKNRQWIESNFILEGLAEYREGMPGVIVWGDAARNYKPQSNYLVYVFKRKT